ncbi:MAG: lipid II flippase MurJ, partial [Patescibacteria group bacterium]
MNVNQKTTILKSAAILAFFTLLSRLVGLYRDHLLAGKFSIGETLDTYYVAFRLPDLVFNLLILGTLSVAFIPVFTDYFIKDKKEANSIANTILSVTFFGMSVVCLVLYIFVPQITHLMAPGFSGKQFDDTVMLTKIFLLSPIIFTISSVFGSVLNALRRFVLVSLAPIIYNFGIIFGVVYLYPIYGIKGLAYGVILGALLHLCIQMFGALASGFKLKPNLDFKHPGVRKVAKLFVPRILGIDNSQISLLVASIIGTTLMSGTVSGFNLANNIQAVAIGMFGISFATAAFPDLSEQFSREDHQKFGETLSRTVVNILFFLIPISVLL